MNVFQLLNEQAELAEQFEKAGLIKYHAKNYRLIYSRFLVYRELGNNVNQSVELVAKDFFTTPASVYKAKRLMEATI